MDVHWTVRRISSVGMAGWLAWPMGLLTVFIGCTSTDRSNPPMALGILEQAASQPGRWMIPDDVLTVGNEASVEVTEAGPWNDGANCSPGFTEGARQLKQWVLDNWPGVTRVGGYNCRVIAGSLETSIHGVGRALDIHFEEDNGEADNDLGDALANYFVMNAESMGVQRIIWDQSIWTAGRGVQARPYGGVSPHTDHIHMEISVAASQLDADFYRDGLPEPERMACGVPLPEAGAIIDAPDPCFELLGPGDYWRSVADAGLGDGLFWTNAFESDRPSNWARWRFTPAVSGTYAIEVHTVAAYSKHDRVRYLIETADGDQEMMVNLRDRTGWYALGEFAFDAGIEYAVAVFDNVLEPVDDEQHITADAVRIINRTPAEPMNMPAPDTPDSPSMPREESPPAQPEAPSERPVEDPAMELPEMPMDEPLENTPPPPDEPLVQGAEPSTAPPPQADDNRPTTVGYVRMEGGCTASATGFIPTPVYVGVGWALIAGLRRRLTRTM
ncbi:MAG: hypothetical protein VX589_11880 [Myxococcota bacterium]|nr:hypothetical protein [Myxococcota bacterium]